MTTNNNNTSKQVVNKNTTRVKIFVEEYYKDIEKKINDWLAKKNCEIVDIKFNTYSSTYHSYYNALVLYKTND